MSLVIETVRKSQGMTIAIEEARTLDVTAKEMTIEAIARSPQGAINWVELETSHGPIP